MTSIIPKVPEMISVKNKMDAKTASASRIILSNVPMFFFMHDIIQDQVN
jgi:hypothetical protein